MMYEIQKATSFYLENAKVKWLWKCSLRGIRSTRRPGQRARNWTKLEEPQGVGGDDWARYRRRWRYYRCKQQSANTLWWTLSLLLKKKDACVRKKNQSSIPNKLITWEGRLSILGRWVRSQFYILLHFRTQPLCLAAPCEIDSRPTEPFWVKSCNIYRRHVCRTPAAAPFSGLIFVIISFLSHLDSSRWRMTFRFNQDFHAFGALWMLSIFTILMSEISKDLEYKTPCLDVVLDRIPLCYIFTCRALETSISTTRLVLPLRFGFHTL